MPKRKTQEEFEEKVKALVGSEYSVIGNYKNYTTKIKMRHNCDKCNNHEWDILPSNFFRGKRCPECFGSFRKTQKQFEKEVYDLVGDEYIVLGEYINNKTNILMRHNCKECNYYEWKVSPGNFIKGTRCPICSHIEANRKKTKSQGQFERDVFELSKGEYEVLGKYKKSHIKILFKHNTCGCEFKISPGSFMQGTRCPDCTKKEYIAKVTKSQKQFENEVKDMVGDEYTVLGTYINNSTKILMKHNICGCEWEVAPNSFLRGTRCIVCGKAIRIEKMRKPKEEYNQQFYNKANGEYSLLSDYEGAHKKVKVKHHTCGYEYDVLPGAFLKGSRCPKCTKSKGEKVISDYLAKFHISYQVQYKIEECKEKYPLPFDVAVFDSSGALRLLIEYQGIQHFKYIEFFHKNEENLIERMLRDCTKQAFCEYNETPTSSH